MLFNSFAYLFFLLTVVGVYYGIASRWRLYWLLAASYLFYGWADIRLIALLLFYTVFNFITGKMLANQTGQSRSSTLTMGLLVNLGMLSAFKYREAWLPLLVEDSLRVGNEWVLPIGISFYALQASSYLIDIYRAQLPPVTHFPSFALYLAFFPHLLAGPIERTTDLLAQFQARNVFSAHRFLLGIRLLLWGLVKKVLVADKLALVVNPVFENPAQFGGETLLLSAIAFSLQIYCDFSGYCDIAMGSAQLLGINLSVNFNRPYTAANVVRFWQRWHMSLYHWFRDYVYVPLGGNEGSSWRRALRVVLVFLLSGIWHGAQFTFLVWGLYHAGCYLLTSRLLKINFRCSIPLLLHQIVTFGLITLGWIFFRSHTLTDAFAMLDGICRVHEYQLDWDHLTVIRTVSQVIILGHLELSIILALTVFYLLLEFSHFQRGFLSSSVTTPIRISHLVVIDLFLLGFLLLGDWSGSAFIYYKF